MNNPQLENILKNIAFYDGYRDAFNPSDTHYSKNIHLQIYLTSIDAVNNVVNKINQDYRSFNKQTMLDFTETTLPLEFILTLIDKHISIIEGLKNENK